MLKKNKLLSFYKKILFKLKNIFFYTYFKKTKFHNDDQFKNYLISLLNLNNKSLKDEDKLIKLKDWCYVFLKRPSQKQYCLDHAFGHQVYEQRLYKIYNFLNFNRIYGFWCGGHAVFLQKIFQLFNYNSITLNIGVRNTRATHVFTLVKLSNSKTLLLDCYFNFVLGNSNNETIDFFEYLQKTNVDYENNYKKAEFLTNNSIKKTFIISKEQFENYYKNLKCKIKFKERYKNFYFVSQDFNLENYLSDDEFHNKNDNTLSIIETYTKKKGIQSIFFTDLIDYNESIFDFLKSRF